ncbi:MAG: hypothetical protein H6779_04665 [Candidatus Nomurabacteria bacterium]|nr:hypothetical protein [Candidatus Nomurabacteria bacterium]USN87666.1 MAG: hypothetical protein H6779_04665 [Candidatus Nomurabacteria bacterium]
MSILARFFRYMRRQPKHVRSNYALAIATSFTGVVALVWFVTSINQGMVSSAEYAKSEGNSPFHNLLEQSKEQFANVKEAFKTSEAKEEVVAERSTAESGDNQLDITLNQEDLDIARSKTEQADEYAASATNTSSMTGIASSSGTVKNESVNQPAYREVQIMTTSGNQNQKTPNSTTPAEGSF